MPRTRSGSPPVVALMGPTAIGKTDLALGLAEHLPVEIVSVDAAQVYRGLDIGTAKPSRAIREAIPHHLVDIRDPAEVFSAAAFERAARAAIADIRGRGRIPVLVGGTLLYFRALFDGLSVLPSADAATRAWLAERQEREGLPALHAELQRVDPGAAERIHPHDPQRVLRALEVFHLSGHPMSAWWTHSTPGAFGPPDVAWRLMPQDRARLHRRIADRFESMLARGLLDEVRSLHQRGDLHAGLPAVRAVGYRQAWAYLAGEIDRSTFEARAVSATRQLAKRQLTWLRRGSVGERLNPDERALSELIGVFVRAIRAAVDGA